MENIKDIFKRKKLIIFDLDGTLIDSLTVWNEVDYNVISKIRTDGKATTENPQILRDYALRTFCASENPYFSYYGLLKEKYLAKESIEEIHDMRYRIATDLIKNKVDYKPYADALIKKLKAEGYVLAIGSTTTTANMRIYRLENRNILNKAPIDEYFDFILTRNDVKEIKPHPEVFIKILKRFNIAPSEALVIEDSLVGLECARNAGIECVIVRDDNNAIDIPLLKESADHYVEDLGELI